MRRRCWLYVAMATTCNHVSLIMYNFPLARRTRIITSAIRIGECQSNRQPEIGCEERGSSQFRHRSSNSRPISGKRCQPACALNIVYPFSKPQFIMNDSFIHSFIHSYGRFLSLRLASALRRYKLVCNFLNKTGILSFVSFTNWLRKSFVQITTNSLINNVLASANTGQR